MDGKKQIMKIVIIICSHKTDYINSISAFNDRRYAIDVFRRPLDFVHLIEATAIGRIAQCQVRSTTQCQVRSTTYCTNMPSAFMSNLQVM